MQISCFKGDILKTVTGHTLTDALKKLPMCLSKKPFRMPKSGVCKIKSVGKVIALGAHRVVFIIGRRFELRKRRKSFVLKT